MMAGVYSLNSSLRLQPKTSIFFPSSTVSATTLGTQFLLKPRNHVAVKCRPDESGKLIQEGLSSITELVGTGVDELLNREENRGLLENLNNATERVERAKKELAEIQRQEDETRQMKEYIKRMEAYTTEIAECQSDVLQARAMIEEAEDLLSPNGLVTTTTLEDEDETVVFDKEKERWESVKAGSIAGVVGFLATLPVSLAQATAITTPQLLLPLAINSISCALFGVTFRYAIRRDIDDSHLKTGAVLAFGLVKGLARFGTLELSVDSLWSPEVIEAGLLASQDVIMFFLAAVGLDLCFKLGLVSPFPSSRGKPPPR